MKSQISILRCKQSEIDRYQSENAAHKIDGYFLPRPNESRPAAFDRAKQECLDNLRKDIAIVEAITYERFHAVTPS